MNVDKFIQETLANKIEEAVAEIRKTILHPDNEPNVTLYPKTSIDQVEQLVEQLDYIKTNLIKDTLIGTNGIVIDKVADSEKIEVSGKNLIKDPYPGVNITGASIVNYKPYDSSDWGSAFVRNTHDLVNNAESGSITGYDNNGVLYAKTTSDDPWSVVNKEYLDDLIGSISPTLPSKYQHTLILEGTKDGFTFKASLSVCSSDEEAFGTFDEVVLAIGSASIPSTGYVYDGTKYYNIFVLDGSGPAFFYLNPELGEQPLGVTNDDVIISDDRVLEF